MFTNGSRIDLHVHSHHSNFGDNKILNHIQINECYTAPMTVYQIAKSRGMDFVTLTDHDTINGALELAHLPDFFISEEITAYFPHDHAKVHILAYGIDENQHLEIQRLRFNIYELTHYLRSEMIVHAQAHPFYRMGPRLTLDHIEQMLLLFNVFEVKNGGKQLMPENLMEMILQHLTPEKIFRLGEKHHINPYGETPWVKSRIAGSDDHGGILITTPHTRTEAASDSQELFAHILTGRCHPIGHGGSPLAVAHNALAVTLQLAKSRRSQFDPIQNDLLWKILENIFEERTHHGFFALAAALANSQITKIFKPKKRNKTNYKKLFRKIAQDKALLRLLKGETPFDHENSIAFFSRVSQLTNELFAGMIESAATKNGVKLSQLKTLPALLTLLAPYLIAFRTENSDRPLMRESSKAFLPEELQLPRNAAVFSDHIIKDHEEIEDIHYLLEAEIADGFALIHFSLGQDVDFPAEDNHFYYHPTAPLFSELGFYLPPVLEAAYDLSEKNCERIYIHTMGPMGMLGILLGKLLKIPVIATFHESDLKRLGQVINNSLFLHQVMAFIYSMASEVRLLDVPSADAEAVLQRSKTKVYIMGDQLFFENEKLAWA